MNNFIDLSSCLDDVVERFKKFGESCSFKTECLKHGRAEAFMNGACIQCKQEDDIIAHKDFIENEIIQQKTAIGGGHIFLNATFNNYNANTKAKKAVLKQLQDYNLDSNILINGNVGNGKTHLAWALVDKLLRQNISVSYIKYYQLFKLKQDKWSAYEKALGSKLLIIDEFGASSTDSKNQEIFEIIDYRYQKGWLMLISNLSSDSIFQMLTSSTYSRFCEKILHITTDWEDYRLKRIRY